MDEKDVYRALLEAQQKGEIVAMATVIRTQGSMPRHAGSKMLVYADGRIVGFLKQRPAVGGETAVRYLVKHVKGEEVPAQFSYRPDVVTFYNLDKFK